MTETYEQKCDRERVENKRFGALLGGFMAIGSILTILDAALRLSAWMMVGYMFGYWPIAIYYRDHVHDWVVEWRFRRAWKRPHNKES
jgi:uncharacterized membrane protein YphA (DoxX/SURF4 family)